MSKAVEICEAFIAAEIRWKAKHGDETAWGNAIADHAIFLLTTLSNAIREQSQPAVEGDGLQWLGSHCRAIGMSKKSDSGKLEHDIALFTALQKDQIAALTERLAMFERDNSGLAAENAGLVADLENNGLKWIAGKWVRVAIQESGK